MPPKNKNSTRPNSQGWSKNIDDVMNESNLESTLPRLQTPTQVTLPSTNGSIYITADKVKTLSPLLEIEKIASVQTLNVVGKITDCLDAFEKTLNSINNNNSNPPPPIKSWVSVTKKGLPNQVYRTTNKSPSEIVKIVNNTLASIKAKTADVNLVNIKGVARLPSGDFHFYTQSRFQTGYGNINMSGQHYVTPH
ncbi:hypothetical protein Pst134EA_022767 [Puccinia striiformis f. sp. tritici]|uniref:hypothetical protein n=1 Tax=Puccinia striiformis f. sp. tritici TaxID=168172 RepID=UPI0020086E70|nr:hypothetical protein Pst134EA_022767 [Puccinia striiformis f. sp. tritici]KAH9455295.1 hypothetical protein Pst134EA_022767 [Puccinia striiformis f. sp. tritici]